MSLSVDPLHWWLAAGVVLAWAGGTGRILRGVRRAGGEGAPGALLIGYASQSGASEALARASAAASGARIMPLDRIGAADLEGVSRAHFYISTTGDGDAPDNATTFLSRVMAGRPGLGGLSYAMLALGDRHYPRFCGFAHRLDQWLRDCGAAPLFPLVELDRDHPDALASWHAQLGEGAAATAPRWRLAARAHLNPGSPGGPLWHLALEPEGEMPDWQAGDIASVTIPTDSGTISRDYSLASLPASGRAELILREVISPSGVPGQGSHWLSRRLCSGDSVAMRIRANPRFRAASDQVPMLLIGNGSGLAGLLAHLRQRAGRPGAGPVWLFHGERSPDHDALFADELEELLARGTLTRLERSFSRGGAGPRYVQDLVLRAGADIRALVAAGGGIWICGRKEGMASDVMRALEEVLGAGMPERLIRENRLKRDIY